MSTAQFAKRSKVMSQLKAVREALGLSLRQVAKETGVSHSLIARVEKHPDLLYPKLRQKLSAALGISEGKLFAEKEKKK
jgi:transcriptional regulator with XRE-family HTH domain